MDNHSKFLSHLKDSHEQVWLAAKWLVGLGYNVKINTNGQAKKHEEWKKYVDNGDLEISLRIEVKGLSCDFTCQEDWPFGKHFIVCAKHSYDNAIPKPFGFIYFNKAKTHAAIVRSSQHSSWYVQKRKDGRYDKIEQEFYLIDVSNVFFFQIN